MTKAKPSHPCANPECTNLTTTKYCSRKCARRTSPSDLGHKAAHRSGGTPKKAQSGATIYDPTCSPYQMSQHEARYWLALGAFDIGVKVKIGDETIVIEAKQPALM